MSSTNQALEYVPATTTGSQTIVIISYFFPALATLVVAGRFISRKLQRSSYGIDDWLILASLLPIWGHTAIILVSVYYGGIGHHVSELNPSHTVTLFQSLTALQFSFGTSLGLIKASIVFLLIRIFATRKFKITAYIVLVYIVCWVLLCILVGAAMCRPFALNWNPTLDGVCGDRITAYICIAAFDIVGSTMLLMLPMPMIWGLHQNTVTKIALSAIFAVGTLDIIVGILRIVYLVDLTDTLDYQWDAVNCWIWSVLEPGLAVLVACAPTLKPLVRAIFSKRQTQGYYESSSQYGTGTQNRSGTQKFDKIRLDSLGSKIHSSSPVGGYRQNDADSDNSPILDRGSHLGQVIPNSRNERPNNGIRMQQDITVQYNNR